MSKKGQAFEVLVKALLVIAVTVILLFIFRGLFGSQKEAGEQQIAGLTGDYDNDGIKDIIDKCACEDGEPSTCKVTNTQCYKCMTSSEKIDYKSCAGYDFKTKK